MVVREGQQMPKVLIIPGTTPAVAHVLFIVLRLLGHPIVLTMIASAHKVLAPIGIG